VISGQVVFNQGAEAAENLWPIVLCPGRTVSRGSYSSQEIAKAIKKEPVYFKKT